MPAAAGRPSASKAGRIAAGTAANLARGSWDVAKAKASSLRDSASTRIAETTGGKIATAIKARATLSKHYGPAQFDEDTLSEGHEGPDAESEVAAFRDRKP